MANRTAPSRKRVVTMLQARELPKSGAPANPGGGVWTWGKGAEGQLGHGQTPVDDGRGGDASDSRGKGKARHTGFAGSTRARRCKGDTGQGEHGGRDDQLVPARYACARLRMPCLRIPDEV